MAKQTTSLTVAIALSIFGYLFLSFLSFPSITPAISFAIGALISGILVSWLSVASKSTEAISEPDTASKTVYVGNLPYKASEQEVRKLFSEFGIVQSVRLLKDRQTGKRRGFGFVEMPPEQADKAITALNEKEFMQRKLKVREAKERIKSESDEGLDS